MRLFRSTFQQQQQVMVDFTYAPTVTLRALLTFPLCTLLRSFSRIERFIGGASSTVKEIKPAS